MWWIASRCPRRGSARCWDNCESSTKMSIQLSSIAHRRIPISCRNRDPNSSLSSGVTSNSGLYPVGNGFRAVVFNLASGSSSAIGGFDHFHGILNVRSAARSPLHPAIRQLDLFHVGTEVNIGLFHTLRLEFVEFPKFAHC